MRLDIDSDDGWETIDDDTRDLIGGDQLQQQMGRMRWRIEAITQKLADVDNEDDDNMRNYSRGYEDDVDNRDHVRKRSESGPNSRRREPCDPHFFFIRGALRHLVVHFPLFGGNSRHLALCLSFSFGHDDEETGQVTREQ